MRVAIPLLLLAAACSLDVSPDGGLIQGNGNGNGNGNGGGEPEISFALDILPLFQQDCSLCHGGAGGLDLDTYEGLLAGGVSGEAVVAGDGADSLLVKRLDGSIPPQMPLDAPPFTGVEIDRIRLWIDQGAQDN